MTAALSDGSSGRKPLKKELWMLEDGTAFLHLEPDFHATSADLPPYVLLHPSHAKTKYEKLIKRIRNIRKPVSNPARSLLGVKR